jgi:hypothetical protein
MRSSDETNLALFIDFDNVALGARDAGLRLRIDLLLGRLLEKGKIIVKKAYADWSHHKEYMADLHEAAIELVEIPSPKRSGKNSADIRLAVDAMELCHDKEHIDTYVIVSGDSDFSPLVSNSSSTTTSRRSACPRRGSRSRMCPITSASSSTSCSARSRRSCVRAATRSSRH